MKRLIGVCAVVLTCLSADAADRLVFAIRYFQSDRDVAEMSNVVVRAAKAGYTGLALVSGRDYTGNWWDADRPDDRTDEFRAAHAALDSWWVMSPDRQRRVKEVARICRANGLELVPFVWSVGYNSMRFAEPEVAASIPCAARKVEPVAQPLDLDGAFGGKEMSRTLSTTTAVESNGLYEITGEVRTEHLEWSEIGGYGCGARCLVSDPEDNGDLIASVSVKGKATRDWTPFALSFASGRHALVKVEVGRWWDSTGACAFRNLHLRQVACTDWVVRGGERMTRKWFADRQSSACMSDPRLYAYFRRSAAAVQKEFAPKKWFLSMDEIRVDCDCAACRKTPFSERLGKCLRAQYDAVKEVSPDATVYVWSDMIDPGHNCRSGDPLEVLPKDTVIALWDSRRIADTIAYFTRRGYRVLGAAYYDLQDEKSVRENYATWQKHLEASGKSAGIMYTTWAGTHGCTEGDYRFLEAFDRPFSHAIAVSDTNRFTCGSGPSSAFLADRRVACVPYLASETGRGECHDIAALAEVPVDRPEESRNYVLCRVGETFCGQTVSSVVSFASFPWKGRVRVTLDVNYGVCGWRDWDPTTHRVVGEGLYKCRFGKGAPVEVVTTNSLTRYLNLKGMKGHDVLRERGDRLINGARPHWENGAFYGVLTSSWSQPVAYRCEDGETFEFLGVIPTICEYECQLAKLDGRFYAIMRGAAKDNFWVSDDGGATFRPCGRLPDGKQRPQLFVYGKDILIAYSAPDEKPSVVRNGRNNLHILLGRGDDLRTYREVLHEVDPLGIVYYDFIVDGDQLYVLWSNASRFPAYVKWGAVQGKDLVLFTRMRGLGVAGGVD